MRYQEVEATIAGLTSPEGPFPVLEKVIDGSTRKVFGGLPDNLRDYYASVAGYTDKDCLVDGERRLSFSDVLQQSASLSHVLVDQYGVQKGDRVAIAMRNAPEWCISFMAVTALGAVAVPMNSWWQGEELVYGLQDCGAGLVILDGTRYARMAGWLKESGLPVIAVDTGGAPLPDEVDRLESLLANAAPYGFPEIEIGPEDLALILYTSGSTGTPKGVFSTQRNVISAVGTWLVAVSAQAIIAGTMGKEPEIQPGILLAIPLFHVTGLHGLMLLSLAVGRKMVMMRKWDVDVALELIEAEKITHINGVPTMSMELLNHPRLADYDLTSLVDISSGGAARPAEQVAALVERFPGAMPSVGYGLTESNAVGSILGQEDYLDRPMSVGRPIQPLVRHRIVDEDGNDVARGEVGEICIHSPANAGGYWNCPEDSLSTFKDGWVYTGDAGYQDEENFLYIVDRLKDIIIRGGENISCLEVEAAIYSHADVAEAAVFSLPDERLGEIVGAAVLPKTGRELDSEQVQAFLATRLAAFKVPQHIWFHGNPLPRIAAGKIDKKQIRSEMIERLGL
ncbi:MAG: acyl--CoA ligase [Gammaproteobacteria bacterium]|nr:acyl--CoA ligase [Gammaproteobacteria bacterium]